MAKSLIEQLRAKRADYNDEIKGHAFILDALTGGGGFRGRVGMPAVSVLGWAADAYAKSDLRRDLVGADGTVQVVETWLEQFPREDLDRFLARKNIAHYVNYTGPIHKTLLSYVNKEDMTYDKVPAVTKQWMGDTDGRGLSWKQLMEDLIRPRCSALGWCPVILDLPRVPAVLEGKELSEAQRRELGLAPRAMPLYPFNVLDWSSNDVGDIVALKLWTCHEQRDSLLGDAVKVEVFSLWYADRVERYTLTTVGGQEKLVSDTPEIQKHDYGRIPIIIFRADPASEDSVRGASVIWDVAVENLRIFNLDSELDDFLRNSCFPILGVPVFDSDTKLGELIAGNGSALAVPQEAKQSLHYVAPPASVPEAMEKRREVLVRELYRAARLEFQKPTGVTTSGVARAYEFEQTNRRLTEIAQSFARCEQEALRFVSKMLGAPEELTVGAPSDFSVEDLASDLQNLVGIIDLGIGATATTELKKRFVRRMLPNMPSATQETIDAELEELQAQHEQDAALEREARKTESPDPADPGDDELN